MGIVIGPVLRRADGYRFDTWTVDKGVGRGYPYRRAPSAIVCQTLDEFIAKSTGCEMVAAA